MLNNIGDNYSRHGHPDLAQKSQAGLDHVRRLVLGLNIELGSRAGPVQGFLKIGKSPSRGPTGFSFDGSVLGNFFVWTVGPRPRFSSLGFG
jgi:hypothetical protein